MGIQIVTNTKTDFEQIRLLEISLRNGEITAKTGKPLSAEDISQFGSLRDTIAEPTLYRMLRLTDAQGVEMSLEDIRDKVLWFINHKAPVLLDKINQLRNVLDPKIDNFPRMSAFLDQCEAKIHGVSCLCSPHGKSEYDTLLMEAHRMEPHDRLQTSRIVGTQVSQLSTEPSKQDTSTEAKPVNTDKYPGFMQSVALSPWWDKLLFAAPVGVYTGAAVSYFLPSIPRDVSSLIAIFVIYNLPRWISGEPRYESTQRSPSSQSFWNFLSQAILAGIFAPKSEDHTSGIKMPDLPQPTVGAEEKRSPNYHIHCGD